MAGAWRGMCGVTSRHGMGTAWARHVMCESVIKQPVTVRKSKRCHIQDSVFVIVACIQYNHKIFSLSLSYSEVKFLTLHVETAGSIEMPGHFFPNARCHAPKDSFYFFVRFCRLYYFIFNYSKITSTKSP
jgi:hypothetical protein